MSGPLVAQGLEPTLLATFLLHQGLTGFSGSATRVPVLASALRDLEGGQSLVELWTKLSWLQDCWDIWLGGLLTPSLWPWLLGLCLSRPISEFFLIRDTSLIPNVLWFEYTVTRAEAR